MDSGPTLNPGRSHLKSLNFTTSAKTFPHKVIHIHRFWVDITWGGGTEGPLFNPLQWLLLLLWVKHPSTPSSSYHGPRISSGAHSAPISVHVGWALDLACLSENSISPATVIGLELVQSEPIPGLGLSLQWGCLKRASDSHRGSRRGREQSPYRGEQG